nr:DUF3179 domain-containing protein [Actinomycetota bacterium]
MMERNRTTKVALLAGALAFVAAACGSDGESRTRTSDVVRPSPSPIQGPLVDPDDIVSGGPPPDGIPPIDEPVFLEPDDVRFLVPQEPVIAVEVNGVAKAYPIRILMWHEIVNDDFDGVPVVVTYCPLCNTGIAFLRPTIDGELLDFGTSGKLYHSNLVMYDRQTNSYWPQALGLAVVGPLLGERLEFVPARILSWVDWREAHPDGLVLSTETGHRRDYGSNPYAGYEDTDRPFLFSGDPDPRLPATEHVLGVAGTETIAFPYSELERLSSGGLTVIHRLVGGRLLAVFWKAGTVSALDAPQIPASADVGAAAAYLPEIGNRQLTFVVREGQIVDEQTGSAWTIAGEATEGPMRGHRLEVAIAIDSFWFDWAAFHPDTAIFRAA